MADSFDFVIVGGGSAGSLLAFRLAESGATVCVLEAGPRDLYPFIHLPAGFMKTLANPTYTWQFEAEPGPWTGGRRTYLPQGRTLGGSSSINGMVFVRGQHRDYDHWRQSGLAGWSWEDVRPLFQRLEKRIGGTDEDRGRGGRLPVTDTDWRHPICEAFIAGAARLGYPRNPDYNGASRWGTGYYQRAIHKGRRISAARAYLYPAMKTGRVDVRVHAQASAILFDGHRATGVAYRRGGLAERVTARREVIVTAGAVNTPKLLQLSGLGPAALLARHGIAVRQDLAGVGENLQDHYSARIVVRAKGVRTINDMVRGAGLLPEIARWLTRRPSVLALSVALAHAFGKSDPGMDEPDFTVICTPASYRAGAFGKLDTFPGLTCGAWQQRPESRGHVRIRSAHADEAPEIQPNYLTAERDRHVLLAALRGARAILATPELSAYTEREELPGADIRSDDELLDFARRNGVSAFHLVGSCRMGGDGDTAAPLDADLRVRGVQGLRVADCSAMPAMVSGNTYATTLMIAEKAADLVLAR